MSMSFKHCDSSKFGRFPSAFLLTLVFLLATSPSALASDPSSSSKKSNKGSLQEPKGSQGESSLPKSRSSAEILKELKQAVIDLKADPTNKLKERRVTSLTRELTEALNKAAKPAGRPKGSKNKSTKTGSERKKSSAKWDPGGWTKEGKLIRGKWVGADTPLRQGLLKHPPGYEPFSLETHDWVPVEVEDGRQVPGTGVWRLKQPVTSKSAASQPVSVSAPEQSPGEVPVNEPVSSSAGSSAKPGKPIKGGSGGGGSSGSASPAPTGGGSGATQGSKPGLGGVAGFFESVGGKAFTFLFLYELGRDFKRHVVDGVPVEQPLPENDFSFKLELENRYGVGVNSFLADRGVVANPEDPAFWGSLDEFETQKSRGFGIDDAVDLLGDTVGFFPWLIDALPTGSGDAVASKVVESGSGSRVSAPDGLVSLPENSNSDNPLTEENQISGGRESATFGASSSISPTSTSSAGQAAESSGDASHKTTVTVTTSAANKSSSSTSTSDTAVSGSGSSEAEGRTGDEYVGLSGNEGYTGFGEGPNSSQGTSTTSTSESTEPVSSEPESSSGEACYGPGCGPGDGGIPNPEDGDGCGDACFGLRSLLMGTDSGLAGLLGDLASVVFSERSVSDRIFDLIVGWESGGSSGFSEGTTHSSFLNAVEALLTDIVSAERRSSSSFTQVTAFGVSAFVAAWGWNSTSDSLGGSSKATPRVSALSDKKGHFNRYGTPSRALKGGGNQSAAVGGRRTAVTPATTMTGKAQADRNTTTPVPGLIKVVQRPSAVSPRSRKLTVRQTPAATGNAGPIVEAPNSVTKLPSPAPATGQMQSPTDQTQYGQ